MNKLIKSENVFSYLKEHCTSISIERYQAIGDALRKEIVINDEELRSALALSESSYLCLEIESPVSGRCKVTETFMYKAAPYDSVSVKCILDNYSVYAVPSQH